MLQARRSSVASPNKWTIVRDVGINKSNGLLNIMENIGGGMAALLKSAVGPIWLGCWLE